MALDDGPLTGAPIGFPSPGGGVPNRAILPNHDTSSDGPLLVYTLLVGFGDQSIVVKGMYLADIVAVSFVDVNKIGNSGGPPTLVSMTAAIDQIDITLNQDDTEIGDFWGLVLTDSAGNPYTAPSPIECFQPG